MCNFISYSIYYLLLTQLASFVSCTQLLITYRLEIAGLNRKSPMESDRNRESFIVETSKRIIDPTARKHRHGGNHRFSSDRSYFAFKNGHSSHCLQKNKRLIPDLDRKNHTHHRFVLHFNAAVFQTSSQLRLHFRLCSVSVTFPHLFLLYRK